jgi:hypothetical protein
MIYSSINFPASSGAENYRAHQISASWLTKQNPGRKSDGGNPEKQKSIKVKERSLNMQAAQYKT